MKVGIRFKTESDFVSGIVYDIDSDNEYLIDQLVSLTKIRYDELKNAGQNPSFPLIFESALRSFNIKYDFNCENALVYYVEL